MKNNATTRFSDRVENYVRYRPYYPKELIETLKAECGLSSESIIADIGSGTGNLARLFLDNGNPVFGVEPNPEMRTAAESILAQYPRFSSVPHKAEDTRLESSSVDFVVAGQAFHWFDQKQCKTEFKRILKPNGQVALVWNERLVEVSAFMKEYEILLKKHSTDYSSVDHRNIDESVLAEFFGSNGFTLRTFPNSQSFDYAGLKGRCFSSSYTPNVGEAGHDELDSALKETFERYSKSGLVEFTYTTNLYFGSL